MKNSNITYQEALRWARQVLYKANVPSPNYDSMELMTFATELGSVDIAIRGNEEIPSDQYEVFYDLVLKRAIRIPLQHLIGYAWFYGRKFIVNENVLIPRMETEMLVEKANSLIKNQNTNIKRKHIKVLDLCSGSGCIGITVALENPDVHVDCTDISHAAVRTGRKNAKALDAKIRFMESDMFEAVSQKYDMIISNPPYIPQNVMDMLEAEVRDYDPRIALTDEKDGLTFYKIIASQAHNYLYDGGYLILEIGDDQAKDIIDIFDKLSEGSYSSIKVFKDLAGRDRMIVASKFR